MINFNDLPEEVVQLAMNTPLHQILAPTETSGSLYLGSVEPAYERDMLNDRNITNVLAVCTVRGIHPLALDLEENGFKLNHLEIDDVEGSAEMLKQHLRPFCQWIDDALKRRENVFVHCQWGMSRSATVVIAYVMTAKNLTFPDAHDYVISRRACVLPNLGFIRILEEWEVELRNEKSWWSQAKGLFVGSFNSPATLA